MLKTLYRHSLVFITPSRKEGKYSYHQLTDSMRKETQPDEDFAMSN